MHITRPASLTLTVLAFLPATALAARPHTVRVPRLTGDTLTQARRTLAHDHLQTGRLTGTRTGIITAQTPAAGRWVRENTRVTLQLKPQPATTAVPAPPITTTPAATPTSVRATIDPSYVLDVSTPQAPPVPVTITYSAADADANTPLPDGELTLSIYVAGHAASSYGCEANVGGTVTTATCDVELPQWGAYNLLVSYSSGVSDVAATGATTTIDVEPPAPIPVTQAVTVAGSWPTDTPTVTATVTGANADVTLTDPAGFEGASTVALTDNLGDSCTATITGETAACTMPATGTTPTSFTVAYPGATTTATSVTSTPDGWGDGQSILTTATVTTNWLASSYLVPTADTTVTVVPPPVTITWAVCYYETGVSCPAGGPVTIPAGDFIRLGAVGIPAADPSMQAPGTLGFSATPSTGVTETDDTGVTDSPSCDAMSSVPGGAWGYCQIQFADPGTYTVQADYASSDLVDYPDETGPSMTINVS